jgi:hypothetical protein
MRVAVVPGCRLDGVNGRRHERKNLVEKDGAHEGQS